MADVLDWTDPTNPSAVARIVEPREVSIAVNKEARRLDREAKKNGEDDSDVAGMYVMVNSLHYADDGTRVFRSVDQMMRDTPNRLYFKLVKFAYACARLNRADQAELPEELKSKADPT